VNLIRRKDRKGASTSNRPATSCPASDKERSKLAGGSAVEATWERKMIFMQKKERVGGGTRGLINKGDRITGGSERRIGEERTGRLNGERGAEAMNRERVLQGGMTYANEFEKLAKPGVNKSRTYPSRRSKAQGRKIIEEEKINLSLGKNPRKAGGDIEA